MLELNFVKNKQLNISVFLQRRTYDVDAVVMNAYSDLSPVFAVLQMVRNLHNVLNMVLAGAAGIEKATFSCVGELLMLTLL